MQQTTQPQYLNCYGLIKAPFKLSPDPEFFFPSKPHKAAKEVLSYAICNDDGFMVLIGEAGVGKTLLLRLLLEELPDNKVPAVLLSPAVSPAGLIHLLLEELGETVQYTEESAILLKIFQRKLLELAKDGRELLIVVDEAQNLPVESMEQLRMLSNIETGEKKLLQILLAGQPGLGDLLEDTRLGQLEQRIVVFERLSQLTRKETMEYVNFRLARAGRSDLSFTFQAKRLLFAVTTGTPRLINRLMDRTLLFACADQSDIIQKKHVICAAETLSVVKERKSHHFISGGVRYAFIALAAVILCTVSVAFLGFDHKWWRTITDTNLKEYTGPDIAGTAMVGNQKERLDKAENRIKIHKVTILETYKQ